jgi:hypothetical protein
LISTVACLVVAAVSTTWVWKGPLPSPVRDQKSNGESAPARQGSGANGAPAAPPAANTVVPAAAVKAAPAAAGGASMPAAPAPAAMPATAPAAPPPAAAARPAEPAAPASDSAVVPAPARATSPAELARGPSLYETGRIGKAAVSEPGVPTNRGAERAGPPEMAVQAKQPDRREGPTPAAYTGVLDQTVLDREIAPRFRLLGDCKADVAHRKRVPASAITGSRLVLRWTILPSGRVTDTQVVATAPADPRVVDCIKERMSGWSFRPGKGGAARIERKFSFP